MTLSRPDSFIFFQFSNLSYFKKLNYTGQVDKDEKIYNTPCLYFIFVFIIFIILKLIYFIKNKNIMSFYKLFIIKHYNYYYYLY